MFEMLVLLPFFFLLPNGRPIRVTMVETPMIEARISLRMVALPLVLALVSFAHTMHTEPEDGKGPTPPPPPPLNEQNSK